MEEKIFYHIHKIQNDYIEEKWKVGNELNIGKEYNQFFKLSMNFEAKFSKFNGVQNVPWKNVYEYYSNSNQLTYENILMLLDSAKNYISEYQILIREICYEQMRKEYFSDLPSRQRCIWLCKKEQLKFWKENLKEPFKIFKVKIEGKTFKTNNDFIVAPSESYNEIMKQAKEYWSYNAEVDNVKDEYLYIGNLEILEEVKS